MASQPQTSETAQPTEIPSTGFLPTEAQSTEIQSAVTQEVERKPPDKVFRPLYQCMYCFKLLALVRDVTLHQHLSPLCQHPLIRTYYWHTCGLCMKMFNRQQNLLRHWKHACPMVEEKEARPRLKCQNCEKIVDLSTIHKHRKYGCEKQRWLKEECSSCCRIISYESCCLHQLHRCPHMWPRKEPPRLDCPSCGKHVMQQTINNHKKMGCPDKMFK